MTNRPFEMCVSGFLWASAVRSFPPTWPLCERGNRDDSLVLFRGSSHIKKNISLGENQKSHRAGMSERLSCGRLEVNHGSVGHFLTMLLLLLLLWINEGLPEIR